jgi:hypothetical protein
MTPEQALENLAKIAAAFNTNLETHQALQQSVRVLSQFIAASKPKVDSKEVAVEQQPTG